MCAIQSLHERPTVDDASGPMHWRKLRTGDTLAHLVHDEGDRFTMCLQPIVEDHPLDPRLTPCIECRDRGGAFALPFPGGVHPSP